MTAHGYTAWVLGAGFSQSLDGPLLPHFFSRDLRPRVFRVVDELGEVLTRTDLVAVHTAYWGGDAMPAGERPVLRPWRDPEEFLSFLDAALSDRSSREASLLGELGFEWSGIEHVRRAARQYVAIATDEFVHDDWSVAQRMERWNPYFRWAERVMKARDVVISFNYDRVVETASSGQIVSRLPHEPKTAARPWLLKLHGSVTWRMGTTGVIADHQASGLQLLAAGHEPVIGIPGPSKYAATTKDLSALWDDAVAVLSHVARIVVVGFRFPPGDSEARRQLLDAIAANENRDLEVHVVLGPMTADAQVVRVQKLLERALAKGKRRDAAQRVHVEPLYAEDFIALDDGIGGAG